MEMLLEFIRGVIGDLGFYQLLAPQYAYSSMEKGEIILAHTEDYAGEELVKLLSIGVNLKRELSCWLNGKPPKKLLFLDTFIEASIDLLLRKRFDDLWHLAKGTQFFIRTGGRITCRLPDPPNPPVY